MKRIFWLLALSCSLLAASAQQVNTLYFLENSPHRHYLNPALAPLSNVYVSLPAIGYTSLGLGNNSLTLKDLIYSNGQGQTVWFLNPEFGDSKAFLNSIRKAAVMGIDAQITLLSFGARTKHDGYWHVTLNERIEGGIALPKDLLRFTIGGGMTDLNGVNRFDLKHLGFNLSAYTELAAGYMHPINDQWAVGGKVKFLYGHAYAGMVNKDFDLEASTEEWNLKGSGYAMIAAPINYPASMALSDIQNTSFGLGQDENGNMDIMRFVKPQGLGAAIDVGFTYKPHEQVQIAASVTDLGFIVWNKGARYNYQIDGKYVGVGELAYDDYYNQDTKTFETELLIDTITTRLKNVYDDAFHQDGARKDGFTRMITPRLNVGVDANFWDNRVGVGVYSQTKFANSRIYEEVTLGAAFRPCHWFQLAASYSFVNGKWSNLGVALGLVTYEGIGLTLAADYVPCVYADYNDGASSFSVPYQTKGINLAFGINIVIGHRQDKDRDGVKDKYDLCSETPKGVIVDSVGCPLDTDGDDVPDYLDECPETPAAAYGLVDSVGCPIDTDGDGVPDYLDQCPETPVAAYGLIDSVGCPLDSDKDGVPDYLDECPDTPIEANGLVDSVGCLLDTDGDGVPDYLDQCPDTPVEAYETVNENGCPADSDKDGVPDYIDECPDTPLEAQGLVDSIGCLLDTDGDSVPDYLDQCPDTPMEAYGMVDSVGCPLDSDGDGVPDYLDTCPNTPTGAKGFVDDKGCEVDSDKDGVPNWCDNCPTIPGTKDNNGCPAIKREVRNLLKKAMQGIQFETGKATIKKSSYKILNQIADIFIANPLYHVEIQGHTDNVGKPSMNLRLSEQRARSVLNYLIDRGVPLAQLTYKGYGDTKPIADNKTSKGRALNRRVEFVISFEEVKYEEVKFTSDSTYVVNPMQQDTVQQAPVDSVAVIQ